MLKSDNKWPIRLGALVIFLLGFIAGGLSLNLYQSYQSSDRGRHHRMEHRMQQLAERLNLNETQKQAVEKIFSEARAQMREIHKESRPRFEEMRKRVDERLQTVLTPEQWQQFQQMRSEMKERRKKRWGEERARD